jgi:hypothetical protein
LSNDFEEGAKAAQEVAKATGKAIDGVRGLGGWLDRIFGVGIENAVALHWSDRQIVRRIERAIFDWERLELLVHKAQERLKKKGIFQTRLPPPKVMLPILEHATMEYEDDLHTLWANLSATAIDPSAEEVETKYVSVLSEMSAADCKRLEAMYAEWVYWEDWRKSPAREKGDRYSSGIDGLSEKSESSVILFYRLGLILPVSVEVSEYHPGGHNRYGEYEGSTEEKIVSGDLSVVALTQFGEKFCKAVIGDVRGLYTPPAWINPTDD